MQFELPLSNGDHRPTDVVCVGARRLPFVLAPNPRARRYILRLSRDGVARVTIPRRGSRTGARRFLEQHLCWLEKELQRRAAHPAASPEWTAGTRVLFRGEFVALDWDGDAQEARFSDQAVRVPHGCADLRPAVERRLRQLAELELPARTLELAALHQCPVRKAVVRNQRTRWGSCSARGTISLNWRLVQVPPAVRDYLILHELMHLREMNHSARFWRQVSVACPDYRAAEAWLKRHVRLLDA